MARFSDAVAFLITDSVGLGVTPSSTWTAWSALVGAVFIRGLGVHSDEQWAKNVTMLGVSALQYLSVGTTAVAYNLFFFLLVR
jgi:hypothetical protein